jgi:hypothetical protein
MQLFKDNGLAEKTNQKIWGSWHAMHINLPGNSPSPAFTS